MSPKVSRCLWSIPKLCHLFVDHVPACLKLVAAIRFRIVIHLQKKHWMVHLYTVFTDWLIEFTSKKWWGKYHILLICVLQFFSRGGGDRFFGVWSKMQFISLQQRTEGCVTLIYLFFFFFFLTVPSWEQKEKGQLWEKVNTCWLNRKLLLLASDAVAVFESFS